MNRRCTDHRLVSVRDVLMSAAAVVVLSTGSVRAADTDDSVPALLRKLSDRRFAVRSQAERELTQLSALDVPTLEEAAARHAEHAARIVGLLERIYIGSSAVQSEEALARAALMSSMDPLLSVRRLGSYGETELTIAAEKALERLSSGDSPAAPLAEAALARHAILSENRAIEKLRSLGARVVFSSSHDPIHEGLNELADGAADLEARREARQKAEPAPPAPLTVIHVYLLREWKGGVAGLQWLKRLRIEEGLQLYLVDGCGVTEADVLPLKAEIPGLTAIPRSAATLGVRWMSISFTTTGCEIAGVTEGLAAEKAGLRPNNIILKVDGDPILTFDNGEQTSLVQRLRHCKPGDTVTLTIQRIQNAPEEEVKVTLSDWSEVPDVQASHR